MHSWAFLFQRTVMASPCHCDEDPNLFLVRHILEGKHTRPNGQDFVEYVLFVEGTPATCVVNAVIVVFVLLIVLTIFMRCPAPSDMNPSCIAVALGK